uniref:PHD-type domain-containing protein n=1 Tax=Monopterus albus TaxID=43700 RepID=A0A3Q3Q7Y9_MONAL|nr:PHD finger protein 11 isoform X2 [Monopterus albus]
MGRDGKVSCVLCHRSEETKTTGSLSTKDKVTAHENCLVFASGIYCKLSPEFDDLFGFSVKDVVNEVKRGSKLHCSKCGAKGATAGCELKRCKKSYHYPCAVEDGAESIEDEATGKYGLYCSRHKQGQQNDSDSGNGCTPVSNKPKTSKNDSETGSSKRKASDDPTAAGPSDGSDSNPSSNVMHLHSKKQLIFSDKQGEKHKSKRCRRRISDDSSNSDENKSNKDMEIFAPLESDLEESANAVPENELLTVLQLTRKRTESPRGSPSATQLRDENRDGNEEEDEIVIPSDTDSESLLPALKTCTESSSLSRSADLLPQTSTAQPVLVIAAEGEEREDEGSSTEQRAVHRTDRGATKPASRSSMPTPPNMKPSAPGTRSAPSPVVPCSDLGLSIDSSSFWKRCNVAGCTQAIFTDFMNEMNHISSRIQSDQASQEDYDRALAVMDASGKLEELVGKRQTELQRRQTELTTAAAAMNEIVSALKR